MSEESVLVEAILTEPDDHVHRLVYADWLLENDPEREGLVRAQGALGPSVRTSLGQKLVPIPAGTFQLGSPETEKDRDPDETAHQVTLSRPFYLGATPVTVGEFAVFCRETNYETEAERTFGMGWNAESQSWEYGGYHWANPGWKQRDDEPVVLVSWEDAMVFCQWLGEQDGREYVLPTEAQWEYACRAGTTTPFFFGEDLLPEHANYDTRYPYRDGPAGKGVGQTTPVGRYPANAFGLYDLHGNVWEWCADWYDFHYYRRARKGKKRDPKGPGLGVGRVLRGGSWFNPGRDCRSALRRCGNVSFSRYQDGNTGFRLALAYPKAEAKGRKRPQKG